MISTLIQHDLDEKQAHLVAMLADSTRSSDSLATICADAGITASGIIDLFRQATFARGFAMSMIKVGASLPDVSRDIISQATEGSMECDSCRGTMVDLEGKICGNCRGKGSVPRVGSYDHQKLIWEATGVIKKGGGVNVHVQQNQGVAVNLPPSVSSFVKDSDAQAYDVDAGDILDGDIG